LDGGLAHNSDPKTTAVLSCLALGLEWRKTPYLEMALKLDPTNVIAAKALIFRYTYRGTPADIRRVAGSMLNSLPADDARRAEFTQAVESAGQSQGGKP
jgi:cytochrome c-type biogenesis protein CcmH/NrfG